MSILACCLAALSVSVAAQPPSDYADTEVSTNFPVTVDFSAMSRFVFDLSLDASPSNAIEVAIGNDSDGDGRLSVGETDYAFGFDCGTWFCRSTAENRLDVWNAPTVEAASTTNRLAHAFVLKRRKIRPDWNLVRVTRRGSAPIEEHTSVRGRLPGFKLSVK